jgi:DNA-binding NarL/FixJ family response regulator
MAENQCQQTLTNSSVHFYIEHDLMEKEKVTKVVLLTPREQEILTLSACGFTKSDIGVHIHLSPHTVDYHIRNAIKKLDAKNITSAVVVAIKNKLIQA